jgi:DNA (cytosine-5)-methyltransferase 1
LRFVDLFAGIGGFHLALSELGHDCVFASEIDQNLQEIYRRNFPATRVIAGDISNKLIRDSVPEHDILCAGFPCQPFSKSGAQKGWRDRTRGTLFHHIVDILSKRHPPYVLLENVGNFERHNRGQTWKTVRDSLEDLGYEVWGTTHKASGGNGLISPHHLGYEQHRERFYIVGTTTRLKSSPFPDTSAARLPDLSGIIQHRETLSSSELRETALTRQQYSCIEHWNRLLRKIPPSESLPSFPIWGDEIGATYPFETAVPASLCVRDLRRHVRPYANGGGIPRTRFRKPLLALLPSYARADEFPPWKRTFIRQNRDWFRRIESWIDDSWLSELRTFPPSLRKLEWNCKGEERDLWKHVLQFRPSGLRAKRFATIPALVSMTTTQIPILGPEKRFITRKEGLLLQGFPPSHELPVTHASAFAALGNAVHVKVVKAIAERLLT